MAKAPLATQNSNMPGTPQPFDPAMLLKKNLKRKVDVRMDKKIAEVPKNSSPYTLTVRETDNGSPVEEFIKLNEKKIGKENVTGTPARAAPKRAKILQNLDLNDSGITKSSRRKGTPKKLVQTPKAEKVEQPQNEENVELCNSPVLETENRAVNRTLAKSKNIDKSVNEGPSGSQIVTGDLASLCAIM